MTVSSLQSTSTDYLMFANKSGTESTVGFQVEQKTDEPEKTKREQAAEKTEQEIKDFFAGMKKYGNTLTYVVKSNLEKIKELVDKKKEELKEANGFYAEPPLSADQKAELMKGIEKALVDYQKELLKELEEKSKAEKQQKQQSVQQGVSLKDILSS